MWTRRRVLFGASALAAVGGLYYVQDHYNVVRLMKAGWTVGRISADYKLSSDPTPQIHLRSSQRLAETFLELGGVFIKAGQHVASLNHVLPPEWTTPMRMCQDRAPSRPFPEIKRFLAHVFGDEHVIEKHFSSFDAEPIAAASLAQVHRATMIDGREVAVKIQYPNLAENLETDIRTIDLMCRAVEWLFPQFRLGWLVREFEVNTPAETNFEAEGRNADETRRIFANNERVIVPEIIWPLTRKQVITMEFARGVKVNDLAAIRKVGMSPEQVSHLIANTFAYQIFSTGWVHCDPHPGNLLINEKKQLILLDHGLYRALDDNFRVEYAYLWLMLLLQDKKGVRDCALRLGVREQLYPLFATMMTSRSWNHASPAFHKKISTDEKRALQSMGKDAIADMTDVLASVPPQMLLLFKCNDLLRSVQMDLGVPTDYFLIFGGAANRAVQQWRAAHAKSQYTDNLWQLSWRHKLSLRLRMWVMWWYVRVWHRWFASGDKPADVEIVEEAV